ncbi:MAG: YaaL family protein [Oscillospiraceae bacterium]|jgi:hypothetical protein|nr:YaaL family protein [Oscillospiraceae bacterium]
MKYDLDSGIKDSKAPKEVNEEEGILKDIRQVCRMIDDAYFRFELESDEDLVDSLIYEIEALKARYRYLLRIAKSKNISCTSVVCSRFQEV